MKKILITILLLSLTGCSYPLGGKDIPIELKLKVDKNKIINNKIIPNIVCLNKLKPETCTKNGDIIQYKYISEEKVLADKITEGGKQYQEVIEKRRADAQFYDLGDNKWQIKIYGGDQFIKDTDNNWKLIQYATTTISAYSKQVTKWEVIKSAYASDATSSPSVDGHVGYYAGNTSWSTVRDRADGDTTDKNASENAFGGVAGVTSTGKYYLSRGVMVFNTSYLTSSATISGATLHVHTGSAANSTNYDNDGVDYVVLTSISLAATTTIANGDYDAFGTTAYSDTVDITSALTGGSPSAWAGVPLTWTLNAEGLANLINKTGYSQIGAREGHDITNDPITKSVGAWNMLVVCNQEHATADYRPILTVTYTIGGGGTVARPVPFIINFE